MDTAYNRRIASINDAIMERYARHAPANFVGKGVGSDSGLDTQYNDVMRGAANHPRALSRAEKEYRMEGEANAFGGSFLDDIGQAFRYTPVGMVADAAQGRDTVLSGRGQLTITHGGAGYGGASAANVGVTMPYREVPYAGVIDKAMSGSGFPPKVVQVGNMDGSGKPQVEAAWYESMDDFVGRRNRMRDSKKVGRMTKDPELVASGGRDFTAEELKFVEDLLMKGGAGFYGGAWYNDWDDFTEAVKGAYDTVKGVWEDYVKPVLDVVGTPLKDALISSGNPYGEAGAGVLELLGYGQNGVSGGMYGRPSGMSGGMYGAPGGRSGGRAKLVKGSPEAKAYMASIRAKRGAKGGNMSMGMGMKGCGEGVFADAKPIAANSLGFSPKLEVEQLNAATGSTSYSDMPSSNPVGSGRKRKIVPKNARGVSSAPTKMGEDGKGGAKKKEKSEGYFEVNESAIRPDPYAERAKYEQEEAKKLFEQMEKEYSGGKKVCSADGSICVGMDEPDREDPNMKELMKKLGYGKKISRKTAKKEREGLAVSGDNSMGAIVAQRGYSKKAQKKSGAVDEVASQNIWDGTKMENTTGRSAKANPSLVLEGGAMSGGAHALTQTNNLQAVYGGAMSKMKSEYSGRGQHGGKSAYNAFVSKTMKETGMKLAEAVKHIKANGLYKK